MKKATGLSTFSDSYHSNYHCQKRGFKYFYNFRRSYIGLLFFFCANLIHAQCDFPFPPVDLFTEDVPILCDGLDGYCSILPPEYVNTVLPGCPANEFSIHNSQLIRFVAGSTFIRLRITPDFCQGTPNGVGIQAAIFGNGHPFYSGTYPLAVNCGTGFMQEIILESYQFEINKPYYILIDGWAGDICQYTITVEAGLTEAQELTEPVESISGPTEVCTGQIATFTAFHPNACLYNWTVTGGIITSGGTASHEIAVEVTDASNFTVCVVATNVCFNSPEACFNIPEGETITIENELAEAICEGDTYDFNGTLLSEAGVYLDSILNDCEIEIQLLTLEILEPNTGEDSGFICENGCINWGGNEICGPGTYEGIYTGFNGCDSVVTLTLELNEEVFTTSISADLCPVGSYEWNGEVYTTAGVYEQTFESYSGCDSLVILTLESNAIIQEFEGQMCSGHFTIFEGVMYTETGIYAHTYVTDVGCDSILILNLEVLPPPFEELNETICEGESIMIGNNLFSESGTYTIELFNDILCDSLVYLNLTVLEPIETTIDTMMSVGDEYNGIPINQDTILTEIYTATNGCDSIVTVNVELMLTGIDDYVLNDHFSLFPNPSRHQSTLLFSLEKAMRMEVLLYSIHGQQLKTIQGLEMFGIGDHYLEIDLRGLASATYLIFVRTELDQRVLKLVVE